ncbi:hypothetical protein L6452_39235 [Arctium lappa]|uniref:Uncharacterized protein n=1 Tax=Arctium lappa TaxID=4217 RepID=A0ACB8XRQ0_ARCLA|nr:hypothetical protein L6452_39235 [Arctium lappa]
MARKKATPPQPAKKLVINRTWGFKRKGFKTASKLFPVWREIKEDWRCCQTLDQLLSFLKANTIDDLNALSSQLVSSVLADGSQSGGPRLCFVNGVWVDQTLPLKPSFKQVVDGVYKAASNQVDFITKVRGDYLFHAKQNQMLHPAKQKRQE